MMLSFVHKKTFPQNNHHCHRETIFSFVHNTSFLFNSSSLFSVLLFAPKGVFTLWCAIIQIHCKNFEIFSSLLHERCNSGNSCKSCNEGSDIGCNLQPVRIMRIACVNYSQHVKTCEISKFSEPSETKMKLVKLAGVIIIIIKLIIRL